MFSRKMVLSLVLVVSMVFGGVVLAASVDPIKVDPWASQGGAYGECGRATLSTGVEYMYACKIDNWYGDMNGTYVCPGDDPDNYGDNEITISNSNGITFDWSAMYAIGAVIVKGGTGANIYAYNPQVLSDTNLNAPGRQQGKKVIYPEVSHTTFCWNPDETEYDYETAFAKGDLAICFISQGFDRWGWTNPIGPGTNSMEIWAAAGQCDTTKGTHVGTVTVVYGDDGVVTATPELFGGFIMTEEHFFAGYEMFPRNKQGQFTVAPGAYTNEGPFNGSPIYVIYHAVVGIPK